ncbi:MAG TPA: ATP-binding protein [Bacteroidia bacterium]|nr:ATP-binding protein [Bacteroidia bacterium]HRS59033.1 ATP-binding protein [Bacteroidia bacterium]
MKDFFKYGSRFFYAGILLISLAVVFSHLSKTYFLNIQLKHEFKRIQREVIDDEKLCNSVFDQLEHLNVAEMFNKIDELKQLATDKNIFIYVLLNNKVILWNTNRVVPPEFTNTFNHFILSKVYNGYYLTMGRDGGYYQFIALKLVQNDFPFENKYLSNDFKLGKNRKLFKLKDETSSLSGDYIVTSASKQPLFALEKKENQFFNIWLLLLYIPSGILIFFVVHQQINIFLRRKKYFHGWTIFLAILIATILGWKILRIPAVLFQNKIFSPEVYASSRLLSSIGDLFIIVFLLSWFVVLLTSHLPLRFPSGKFLRIVWVFIFFCLALWVLGLISDIISGLIINSSIPFDMNDFLKFNIYTFFSFLIIFLMFFSFIRLVRYLAINIRKSKMENLIWIIGASVAVVVYLIFNRSANYYLLNPLFLLVTFLFFIFEKKIDDNNMAIALTLIILSAAFTAHQVVHAINIREIEKKKLLVNQVISGRDALTEYLLNDIAGKIEKDNYLVSFYTNPMISRNILAKRLKQIYFSGYFSNYEFELKTFSSSGMPFKSSDTFNLSTYDTLIEHAIALNASSTQYFISSFEGTPLYFLKLPVSRDSIDFGYITVLLKRKIFLEESIYPDLVIEKDLGKFNELSRYSYAIYRNNQLISQKGEYFYPTNILLRDAGKKPYHVYKEGDYDHLCYHFREDTMVILSSPSRNIYASLALASFLFFISSVLYALLNYLFVILSQYIRQQQGSEVDYFNPLRNISFKAKIQMIIMFSVLIAVIISGYLTIYNLIQNISKTNEKKIQQEIVLIASQLNDYFTENEYFGSELDELVEETSAQFRIDINVFDPEGMLVSSSQMPVYERKILSQMIDPEAYKQLKILRKSVFLHTEQINDKLSFTSAYIVLRDENKNLLGFVNIPYYSRFLTERSEITSLIVNMVNLYVFLLLLILFVSVSISGTFTQPLEVISMHLSELKLGRRNKKIEWSSQDEIGRLISEYNKMVENVERSAEALSRSERESAWREMAQQVAHEIKNPLTPMKLSLQRLLISWTNNDPELEQRFRKTTEVLINQIDNLSQIATEFSEFARMPEPVMEVLTLETCLNEVVDLYKAVERVEIIVENEAKDIRIYADPGQLKRAFNNLIKNAIQAIPADRKGRVLIKVIRNASIVLISIADNGLGINRELQDKIFLPSFSTKSSGMGLGLAIVSKIIKSFNGQIWFDTIENEGTTFYISLPVVESFDYQENNPESGLSLQ